LELILTHENADFDAVASLLAAHKLYPQAIPVLSHDLNSNVDKFITLYQAALPFVNRRDLNTRNVERIILVDTQHAAKIRHVKANTPVLIIDHHPASKDFPPHVTLDCNIVGSTTTMLVERIRDQRIAITSLEATLMMLGIYADTGSLTYDSTTARDARAAAWLLEQNAVLDTVRHFLTLHLDDVQTVLFDKLIKTTHSLNISGYTVAVGVAEMPDYIHHINSVAHRLCDMIDPDALVVVVQMPQGIQMVFRSSRDAVDVGAIAGHFGGGGHSRAAAAHVDDMSLEKLVGVLWEQLEKHTVPMTIVEDLMSYSVQTVDAGKKIIDIIQQLRRIGHEGYPVKDGRKIVGLLTLCDADRTLEHGLKNSTVRDIMSSGNITLHFKDSVSMLEQVMVDSGWGQIPVLGDGNELIGIVTRTDLIKHWAQIHPAKAPANNRISDKQIETVLGGHVAVLIEAIANHAQKQNINMYMVGGVVRDLFLNRPNLDIDLVLEADAINFARSLCDILGGEINSHRPFGTATWILDEGVVNKLQVELATLPDHIDFATSRNEFYDHPTALPSVYSSSIKLDLLRRDFTMNTLAIQLSPERSANRLLDFYGGFNDLQNKTIRVLHSLSFVDDPTRVLRAIRFEHRLGFTIEKRTAELIDSAHPMLRRITGERLRNELKSLLNENEPERELLIMQGRGILPAIHPDLNFDALAVNNFKTARETQDHWPLQIGKIRHIYWHIIMSYLPPERLSDLCGRLLFGRNWINSFILVAKIMQQSKIINDENSSVSDIVHELEGLRNTALVALWIMSDEMPRQRIEHYLNDWKNIQSAITGHTLRELGLPPGPQYRALLGQIRDARLNAEVKNEDEERQLLDKLLKEAKD
jgi:tRNA nucleotidyltransferase (CCA-adding enzyme)